MQRMDSSGSSTEDGLHERRGVGVWRHENNYRNSSEGRR